MHISWASAWRRDIFDTAKITDGNKQQQPLTAPGRESCEMNIAPPAFWQKWAQVCRLGATGLRCIARAQGSAFPTLFFLQPSSILGTGARTSLSRSSASPRALPAPAACTMPGTLRSQHPSSVVSLESADSDPPPSGISHTDHTPDSCPAPALPNRIHPGRDITPPASRQGCGEQGGPSAGI